MDPEIYNILIIGVGVGAGDDQTTIHRRRSNRGPLTLNSLTEKEKRQKGGTITQEHKD